MSMRLYLTGEVLSEIGAVSRWVRTGKEPRWSAECEAVDWVVVVGDAKDETGFGMLSESLWCPESPWFSEGSLGRWEPEGRHTLVLSPPTILRGCRPPKLCHPGRVKCRLGSPCSLPWRTCRLGGFLRQRTAWVRFPEGVAILADLDCSDERGHRLLHSWLRKDELGWVEFQTCPKDARFPVFCWKATWNGFLPACVYELLPYCCRSRLRLSDWSREVPTWGLQDGWLPVLTSWCADWIPVETIVRRGDDLANWLPSLWGKRRWKRTGWVLVDVTELPWEHLVCWTNAGEIKIRHPVIMECHRTACVGSSVAWSRTGETWVVGVHDGWRERSGKCDWLWMKVFLQAWPWTLTDGIGVVWEKLGMTPKGRW